MEGNAFRAPPLDTLADLADALDVSPAYLLQELASDPRQKLRR